ncbi:odorant receptor 13a-like [Prorops nasuta]|uniref:odorant receptor 13a-like n=1 Tax=Prorops nasuta TaxID=863751 RepID=UPI0034CDD1A5
MDGAGSITEFPQMSYYNPNRFLLTLVGQWPNSKGFTNFLKRAYVNFIVSSFIVPEAAKLVSSGYDLNVTLDLLPMTLMTILVPINASFIYTIYLSVDNKTSSLTHVAQLERLLKCIKEDWMMERTEEETRIKESFASLSYKFTTIVILFSSAAIAAYLPVAFFLSQILDFFIPLNETRPRMFAIDLEFFIDKQENFYIISCYCFLGFTTGVIFFIANQTMFLCFMLHIYGMFAVLGYRLENSMSRGMNITRSNDPDLASMDHYKSIVLCIKRHQRAIKFAKEMEYFYAPFSLTFLITSVLMLSPTLVLIADKNLQYRVVLQAFYIIIFLFGFSYMGQLLINMSTSVHDKAYCSNWEYCSPAVRKLLLLMIKQSERPCTISAYKLYVASLDCFRMVMQTVLSYFMVLQQFH